MSILKENNSSLIGPSHPVAGLVCLFGFFLHILLSDPLLNAIGFHYSGEEGQFYEKIHPGTLFIFLSFAILLWDRGNPIRAFMSMLQQHTIFVILLLVYILLFVYLVLRSGPSGTAFLIDTHMTVPMCAIVLSYAPLSYCRRAVYLFLLVAGLNSTLGVAEALGKFRLFAFNPAWSVVHEQYFRASALRGHPLVNALFTSIALFVALALPMPRFIKGAAILLFTAGLVAFGSRAAALVTLLGLVVLGCAHWLKAARQKPQNLLRLIGLTSVVFIVPLCFIGFIALLLYSGVGDRLMAAAYWDDSAASRMLALHVFDHMSMEDILFGISGQHILDITAGMNGSFKLGGIENPWLLMFMFLGAILFPLWLAATGAFLYRLMQGQTLALQCAVWSYILIASTFNSFGSKDSTYLIMVCAVICAARAIKLLPIDFQKA